MLNEFIPANRFETLVKFRADIVFVHPDRCLSKNPGRLRTSTDECDIEIVPAKHCNCCICPYSPTKILGMRVCIQSHREVEENEPARTALV